MPQYPELLEVLQDSYTLTRNPQTLQNITMENASVNAVLVANTWVLTRSLLQTYAWTFCSRSVKRRCSYLGFETMTILPQVAIFRSLLIAATRKINGRYIGCLVRCT